MSTATPTTRESGQPKAVLRVLAGVVAALAAVGVGHGVAALMNPVASPLFAVGSTLIDAAPTPAKEFAVRTFGTNDKPILLTSIGAVLLVFAAILGLIAWRHRRIALVGISLLGVVGILTAVARGSLLDGAPSLVAVIVGVSSLYWLSTRGQSHQVPAAEPGGSRRGFLLALGATTALAGIGGVGGIVLGRVREAGSAARRAVGLPAPASAATAIPAGAQLDIAGITPFTTATEDFYRVDIALVTPRVNVESWSLTIDGMVDNPVTLTYDELVQMPMIERDITLTCVSNEVGGSYVGSTRWLGVPFSEIIKLVGVQPGVEQAYSYSSDSGYTCSTPFQALNDGRDAMIVVGMNGEVINDAHGFPARMLVPGLYGFVSATKWLERIEFTTYAARSAYWTDRKWATDSPILTASRIDVPKSLSTLAKDKPVIAGVAWAQHRGVEKVEIRIDEGDWQPTKLADDAGIDLWRQWSYVFDGPAGLHSAQVRTTDMSGETQPEERTKVFPSGARGWHQIQFTSE